MSTPRKLDDILSKLIPWTKLSAEDQTADSFQSTVGVAPADAARMIKSAVTLALERGETISVVDFMASKKIPADLMYDLQKLE